MAVQAGSLAALFHGRDRFNNPCRDRSHATILATTFGRPFFGHRFRFGRAFAFHRGFGRPFFGHRFGFGRAFAFHRGFGRPFFGHRFGFGHAF